MNNKLIYGDPSNIDIFDDVSNTSIILDNGKLLSNEPYVEEQLTQYNETFTKLPKKSEYSIGDTVTGTIASISENDILLNIGGKDSAYISMEKDKVNSTSYEIGEEVEALVMDTKEYLKVSIVEYIKTCLYNEMKDANNHTVYDAEVLSLTENGYVLDIEGVKVFMPGSLGGINKLIDFQELIGQTIKVLPIKNENRYSKFKDQLIVSHRAYLETLIPTEIDKLEIGAVYEGTVTGSKPFGVFIEFNEVLTGMIHKDDFDDSFKELFENGEIVPGQVLDFYLKEVVTSRKIILSRFSVDPDEVSKPKFEKGDVVEGKVVKTVKYGSFVSLGRNATGLIHISKLKNGEEFDKGDIINVKITDNKDNKYVLELA
tara:strand:+ start:1940 stop:3055 length:1116 start_codon:yes stop_codon:yes gene_type:complete